MYTVRQANENDITAIDALYKRKVDQLAEKGIKQWDYETVTWKEMSKSYKLSQFHLVYQEDNLVGAFVVMERDMEYWPDDEANTALYLHKLLVDDGAAKSGLSSWILEYFKQLGRKYGYQYVKLDVREYKHKLRSFYEQNGFELKEIVDLNKGYLTCLYICKL